MKAAEYLLKPAMTVLLVAQMLLIHRISRQRDAAIRLSKETLKACEQWETAAANWENQATQAIATATKAIALYDGSQP